METAITDTSKSEKLMVKVFTHGQTERCTTVNGFRVSNKGTGYGEDFTTTHILVNGLNLKLMVMACTHGKMGIATKENGTCV